MNKKDVELFTNYVNENMKIVKRQSPAYQPIIIPHVNGLQIYNPRSMKTYFISHKEFWNFLESNGEKWIAFKEKEDEN